MPKIPSNLPQPPNQVFGLATPRHMFMKLHWEIKELKARLQLQSNSMSEHVEASYFAFNAAVTSWHLCDWVWNSLNPTGRRELAEKMEVKLGSRKDLSTEMAKRSQVLAACRDIANGSKHKKEIEGATIQVKLEWNYEPVKAGQFSAGTRVIEATYDLVVLGGDERVRALDLFTKSLQFWRQFLETLGFLEPQFTDSGFDGDPNI